MITEMNKKKSHRNRTLIPICVVFFSSSSYSYSIGTTLFFFHLPKCVSGLDLFRFFSLAMFWNNFYSEWMVINSVKVIRH